MRADSTRTGRSADSGPTAAPVIVTAMSAHEEARAVALPDGRMLEFADYGDPRGVPVVAHHGSDGSRAAWGSVDGACRAAGVRLIAPDRPGYGGSTPAPQRRIVDWPADLVALVDALGLESVALMSLREGVAYATAAAAALPDRVERAALVACRRAGGRRARPPAIALDAHLVALPWGFELSSVTVPTSLWSGGLDTRDAHDTVRWLRGALPHAELVVDATLGSYSLLRRAPDILAFLLKRDL
jgi:hypothetical protein